MKILKLENTFRSYDEDGTLIDTITSIGYQLTPDEGKCFVDPDTKEKIIRKSDGKGAVIEIPSELLDKYEEVDIE